MAGEDDFTVISGLHSYGAKYLDDHYGQGGVKQISFEKLYCSNQIFPNGAVEYLNYLPNSNHLWTGMVEQCSDEELFQIVDIFIPHIIKQNFEYQMRVFWKILSPRVADSIDWTDVLNVLIEKCTFSKRKLFGIVRMVKLYPEIFRHFNDLSIDTLNENLPKINLDYKDFDNYTSDDYLMKLFYIIFKLWRLSGDISVEEIDCTYLTNPSCGIRWYNKQGTYSRDYNVKTQLFFLVLNGIRIIYNPILDRTLLYPKILEDFNQMNNGLIGTFVVMNEMNKVKTALEKNQRIIALNIIKSRDLLKFYKFTSRLILENRFPYQVDDLLNDLIGFAINKNKKLDGELEDLSIKIINSDELTRNTELKLQFLSKLEKDELSEPNKVQYYNAIVVVHNRLDTLDLNIQTKLSNKMEIYNIIINGRIKVLSGNSRNQSMKFVSIIFNDYFELDEQLNIIIEEYKRTRNSVFNKTMVSISKHLLSIINFVRYLLHDQEARAIIMEDSLRGSLIQFINLCVNRFVLNEDVINILNSCYNFNRQIIKELKKDDLNFKYENYATNNLSHIMELLDEQESEEQYKEEIPDEFLDPLMYCPIENPVLLPGSEGGIMMEKSIIVKHLLNKEEHPFNRTPLTIEQLDEFNAQDGVKAKIADFIGRFSKWKEENSVQ